MKVHDLSEPFRLPGKIVFRVRCWNEHGKQCSDIHPTCSFCGSLTVADVLKAFQTKGTQWSGSDWKYGWPHKFYISIPCEPYDSVTTVVSKTVDGKRVEEVTWGESTLRAHKFYSEHLIDATPEQLAEWNRVVKPITGIGFEIVNSDGKEKLMWNAPCSGHQAWGTI